MSDKYQQEGNSDFYQTEDASGDYLLEIQPPSGARSLLAVWIGGASLVVPSTGPSAGSLSLMGVGR